MYMGVTFELEKNNNKDCPDMKKTTIYGVNYCHLHARAFIGNWHWIYLNVYMIHKTAVIIIPMCDHKCLGPPCHGSVPRDLGHDLSPMG